jgi:hypothetical protein
MVPGLLDWIAQERPHLFGIGKEFPMQDEKERRKQEIPLAIDTLRTILDMPVAYSFMKPGSFSGKVVGACGTATSLIAMYQQWK